MGIFSKTMENGGKLYRLWTCCAGGEGAVIPCKPFAFDLSCDPLFYWVILDRWIIIIIIILRYNWPKLKNSFGSCQGTIWFGLSPRQDNKEGLKADIQYNELSSHASFTIELIPLVLAVSLYSFFFYSLKLYQFYIYLPSIIQIHTYLLNYYPYKRYSLRE